ncbi:MAG: PepSY domain-containing protein [Gammaproteobacteria bacterium]|nr:PepSY domain-containing protein [Gammaproteobacteria bacterium]
MKKLIYLLFLFSASLSASDDIDVRELEASGKIVKLTKIIEQAVARHPGRVIEINLNRENGQLVYQLEIIDHQGVIKELSLDAKTGQLLQK